MNDFGRFDSWGSMMDQHGILRPQNLSTFHNVFFVGILSFSSLVVTTYCLLDRSLKSFLLWVTVYLLTSFYSMSFI